MTAKRVHVAVGVIVGSDNKICISLRAPSAHQGGLWEFPGGKVDAGETLEQALARELSEELGIGLLESSPLIQIRHDYGDKVVLLDVHKVTAFSGEPYGKEGQPVRWCHPHELRQLEFPAANYPIITAINLPNKWLITGSCASLPDFLCRLESALQAGIKLIQLRIKDVAEAEFIAGANAAVKLCAQYSAQLQINATPALFLAHFAGLHQVGLHLNTISLGQLSERPVADGVWLSASCHNPFELQRAEAIGVDFACLSPVKTTQSHPQAAPLGWLLFADWLMDASIPVFALGGMIDVDLERAMASGAQGIAGISNWWD